MFVYFYKSKQDWIPERLEYILYGFMPQGKLFSFKTRNNKHFSTSAKIHQP